MRTTLDDAGAVALDRSRTAEYIALTKPELTLLSVLTTLAGFVVASPGPLQPAILVHTLMGTALIGGGAGALNQLIERRFDALMKRTEKRPIPSGKVTPGEALFFGIGCAAAGLLELTLFVNMLTAFLAVATLSTYLFVYTPLKRITPACTLVGAIPGAIPPVMGWTAACGEIGGGAWILFAILFTWQMPHFLSLAWIYREDYTRAGYRILTVGDPDGTTTGRHIALWCVALVGASLLPAVAGDAGPLYLAGTFILATVFLGFGLHFLTTRSMTSARRVFSASLVVLPAMMAVLVIDRIIHP